MPRSTRRSEEPSAADQPDVNSDIATPIDDAIAAASTETTTPPRNRTRQRARPSATRPPSGAPSVDEPTDAASPKESEQAPSRIRRPVRIPPKPILLDTAVGTDGAELESSIVGLKSGSADPVLDVQSETSQESNVPPARRRVGGRRSAAAAAAALTEADSDEIVAVPDAPARSSRNRRRRGGARNNEKTVVAETAVEPAVEFDGDIELDELPLIAESSDDTAQTSDDELKKSRRSRRGGRRRTGRAADGDKSAETETEVSEEEIEEDDPLIPLFKPTQIWAAPSLVPHPKDLGLIPSTLRVEANLSQDLTGFEIDGHYFGPELFFVNADTADDQDVVSSQIALAASTGLHLHSGVAYLPLKNAYGNRSFASIDSLLSTVLAADPEAYIVVRLQLVPTNFWARTHPEELAKFSDGNEGDVSFASRTFWEDAVDAIGALTAYLADESTNGGDRVVGIHLDKGEWFNDANSGYDLSAPNKSYFQSWLHEKYQSNYALRAAWFSGTAQFETAEIPKWPGVPSSRKREDVVLYNQPRDRKFADYNAYTSDVMAHAITGMAQAVKWLSGGQLLVGASYGYTFEFAARNDSGHQSLYKVLQSADIDVIAGPNTYANRGAGAAGAFGSPVDSAKLHGKLWLVEDDTKTYLAEDDTEDSFNPKVASFNDTISVLRRNSAAAYVHGCGIVWMDLWGKGWLNSRDIWSEISELRSHAVSARRVKLEALKSVPEVAVLVDEASYAYIRGDSSGMALQTALINKSRELIYRSGASVAFYLQSDVALLPDNIKLYIFLNALRVTTSERQVIREKLQKQGKTLVWIYGPGVFDERGESPAEVTEIVGMPLKAQPWSSHIGTIFTEERHPITERLHGGKRLGTDDILNPSYAVVDPAAIVLGEYSQTGSPSVASKINEGGWKSVFVGEPYLTGELLRGIYRFAGIHVCDAQDDVVHIQTSGLLLIHAPYTGQRTIHLPYPTAVYSLYEKRLVTQSSSTFRAFMRGRSTNFFLWGELDRIAYALATTAEALKEQQAAWKLEREANGQRGQRGNDAGRDGVSDESESDSQFAASDELVQEGANQSENYAETAASVDTLTAGLAEVDMLVRNGLIADGSAVLNDDSGESELDEVDTDATSVPVRQNEPMSPSRRRRWNRKRNMQAAKEPGATPVISMEDLLSDLPPRKPNPPRTSE